MSDYFWNLLEATSQWLNALRGGNPNITVSAQAYLDREKKPRTYRFINRLFWKQEDHCRESWVEDIVFARKALFELEVPRRPDTPLTPEF